MKASSLAKKRSVAVLLSGREQFSPYFGGALARWTHEVYTHLSDQIAVTVFGFPTAKEHSYALRHESSHAWRACQVLAHIPVARRYEDYLWLGAIMPRLRSFDAIHIHNRPGWVTILRRMSYRGVIILHLQNDHLGHWSSAMLDALAASVDAVAVCSAYLRGTFAPKSALLTTKTHVIFNGANLQTFYPREELREPKTIFFVGRLDPEKGVLQLVQAYEKVLDTHPDAKLVIGGSSSFGAHRETAYVRQVRELASGLEKRRGIRIHFSGYLDHDKDLPLWFQKASLFASPSIFQEPFGLVNAESMACSTTVVAANRGGIPEVIGDAGRLVDPENVDEFASAISELLSNPEYCRELGRAGYERCRKMFDWRVTAEAWMGLLERVISNTCEHSER